MIKKSEREQLLQRFGTDQTLRYEDPPCPYEYDEASECPDRCFFVPILNEDGDIIGWKDCCMGCADDMICRWPSLAYDCYSVADVVTTGGVWTDCEPYDTSEASLETRSLRAMMAMKDGPQGFLSVQRVDNPSLHRKFLVPLDGESSILQTSGWIITFLRLPRLPRTSLFQSVGDARVFPSLLPMDHFCLEEKSLTATVILPDGETFHQYTVAVSESSRYTHDPYRFAQLMTNEWSVLFVREPFPRAQKSDEPDCGCKDE